jgi:hypothetical protein
LRAAENDAPGLARVDLDGLRRSLGARKLDVLQEVGALRAESGASTEAAPGEAIAAAKAAESHGAT